MNREIFKTKESLQEAIDNSENYEGMEEYLDDNFAYLMFDLDVKGADLALNGEQFIPPYWMEKYYNKFTESGENKYLCEYIEGYHEPLQIGEVVNEYKYIDSQPLPEEMEHQADNGDLVYEYRGPSFLRIWEKI